MTEGAFRPTPPTPEEIAGVQQVVEILSDAYNPEQVLNALRRNHGDVQKAISALLDDPTSGDIPPLPADDISALREAAASVVQSQSLPHLTGDTDPDEDMKKAMAASLEDIAPILQPSTRAPNPDWAMVPSNAPVTGLTQDEQDMNQAIQLSLQEELSLDQFDEKPLEERLRKGVTPVALRASKVTQTYAAMVMHALYFVPQVRRAIASYLPYAPDGNSEDMSTDLDIRVVPPTNGPARLVWSMLETFVYLDLARLTELSADSLLDQLPIDPWSPGANGSQSPGHLAFEFYAQVALAIESVLHLDDATTEGQPDWPRLFHFRHGPSNREPDRRAFNHSIDDSIAKVHVSGHPDINDLVSCLDAELKQVGPNESQPQVIVYPSEVVAFQLLHHSSGDRQKFSFPPYFYLDQFMHEKSKLANEKRRLKSNLLQKIAELEARRKALTKFQDRDTLADLQSAAYYYENIAEDEGSETRRSALQDTAGKLRKIISQIETELQNIDANISQCKAGVNDAFNCPGLHDFRYELRAVLMHDGFYGRNHLYSYVKEKGVWWKTIEHTITEVSEEEVLEDPTGLHLSAGPFLLIYSRGLSPNEENEKAAWPEDLKNNVKRDNQTFFETLGPEVVAGFEDPNSPLTAVFPLPSDTETSSMDVEPPSRTDDMDLDV
ncbi:hypothetical protein PHLGIDRAFT_254599 [Phlebiopsis gigantea 11061_1 CR5-6]|uniref:UBA domain-containing protein n=1 Tax=Phlebiopsis gigantea (strain 11061_1 CR5-6) TaxID=745531 RepID=A0A0C3S4Q6_PHLG1|nr:hypothetical protein PHLGIDRAFT_254599 [Phlebiopsis gigantea 11061_1 CR5-6]